MALIQIDIDTPNQETFEELERLSSTAKVAVGRAILGSRTDGRRVGFVAGFLAASIFSMIMRYV